MGGRRQVKQKGVIKTEQKITLDVASAYVKTVKETFEAKGQISKYKDFLQLLKDLKTDTDTVPFHHLAARINDLFRLHPQLVVGFNVFLPRQYHIDPDSATPSGRSDHCERFR